MCAQDQYCFLLYPSMCEFKSSLPPTTTFRYIGKAVNLTVCDNDFLNITCKNGKQIAVISAYYGSKNDTEICGGFESNQNDLSCDYNDATFTLREFLSHYSSISVK